MNKKLDKRKLETKPYKGVRDFYPPDMAIQNYIFGKMRKITESFGYVEYGASILEPTELYEAKSGEELIKEQTYSFIDRGGRNVTLRPEMTPTIARIIAGKRQELSFPLRWYSIPNAFRYERPQRGRVREHWQLNADLFGADGIDADAEIISLAEQILKELGAKNTDFEIKINFIGILTRYLKTEFKLDDKNTNTLIKTMDKYEKISQEDFEKITNDIIGKEKSAKLLKSLKEKNFEEFSSYKEIKYLEELKNKLSKSGISIIISPFLTRGFDYYTGMVFEVYDTDTENNRSLFGGGRYDNLLEIFGVKKIPAVGFGMGDAPIQNFLERRNLIPKYTSSTNLMLCALDSKNIPYAQNLAKELRSNNLNIAVNLSNKKIGEQIKTADKQNIPFVICIGEKEEKTDKFKIKKLATGEETEANKNEIADIIKL